MPNWIERRRDSIVEWLRRPSRIRVTGANFVVVFLATMTTAVLALIAEDLLPKTAGQTWFVPWRWIVGVVLATALFGALALRAHMNRTAGTLFYVHLLDEGMADRQEDAVAEAGKRHLAIRSVSRWVDLSSHTTPAGVIDVPGTCADIGTRLQDQINADNPDTGYVIAPNMLWPMALAVGAYLPPAVTLRMLELQESGDPQLFAVGDAAGFPVQHTEQDLGEPSDQERIGVWLAFGRKAAWFHADDFARFGVSRAHTITYPGGPPPTEADCPEWTESQLQAMPQALADRLLTIKKDAQQRELVVTAMIPKTVALAVGRILARSDCRFFTGTHLMNYDGAQRAYVPMRVSESQPVIPPRVAGDA